MKKTILVLFFCWMAGQARADDLAWLESVPPALELAQRENKLVLLDFTGSDWCGWCKKLDAETFAKPEFADYARKNLVLVQLDFPRQKPQAAELTQANNALKQKYGVTGFPSLVALQADGSVVWKQTGYLAGGPAAMIAKLDGLRPQPRPSTSLASAQWPAAPPRIPGAEPKLQAIFYSSSHRSVMLDGKSCETGDTVHGMKVLKIAPDKVTVLWHGQTEELKIN